MMELKSFISNIVLYYATSLNRTMMELKSSSLLAVAVTLAALIVP